MWRVGQQAGPRTPRWKRGDWVRDDRPNHPGDSGGGESSPSLCSGLNSGSTILLPRPSKAHPSSSLPGCQVCPVPSQTLRWVDSPRLESCLSFSPAGWLWAGYSLSLSFSFLLYKMGRAIPSQQCCRVMCGKIAVWSLRTADALVAVPAPGAGQASSVIRAALQQCPPPVSDSIASARFYHCVKLVTEITNVNY